MASMFTFDPDPPGIWSPWTAPLAEDPARSPTPPPETPPLPSKLSQDADHQGASATLEVPLIKKTRITRVAAEPQSGPTEYKLHLLLRRRRSFTRASGGHHVSGSMRRSDVSVPVPLGRGVSASRLLSNTPPPSASTQSKQHRLQQLTTQLLWRLQQSCSDHSSSSTVPVFPLLPDGVNFAIPDMSQRQWAERMMPERLLPGLEESEGAMYEIGIADDGTVVGLAEDEMAESLDNLRAMAASLGCGVDVLHMLCVGECEWVEWVEDASPPHQRLRNSKLVVAEAIVRPAQHLINRTKGAQKEITQHRSSHEDSTILTQAPETRTLIEQLRVSVTGATGSGKSSLLGTLSTATLDNGRGMSRISLLKHRHEIASGMTSSVTQELIGYRNVAEHQTTAGVQVVSYGDGNVSSWLDIHAAVGTPGQGRLCFLTDSAGHLRFRRTVVRGIVGWQPHWTLLCIPADNTDESSGKIGASPTSSESLGPATIDLGLSQAHIQLCLDLELPLVVVITKLDLAGLAALRLKLSKVLSTIKAAGRAPKIITDHTTSAGELDLHAISSEDLQEAHKVLQLLEPSPLALVPIVLTSAVKGTGISKLHAFFRQLPIPAPPALSANVLPSSIFYIEDVYSLRARGAPDRTVVIGGYLKYGTLAIGDELLLGPYPMDLNSDDSDSGSGGIKPSRSASKLPSRSFPGALKMKESISTHDRHSEWRRVRITSLRNLRLPVRKLFADQVGTMGVTPIDTVIVSPSINRIRKGMVLTPTAPRASKVIDVRFEGAQAQSVQILTVGSVIPVYVASVRTTSKVISIARDLPTPGKTQQEEDSDHDDDDDAFGFGFDDEESEALQGDADAAVTVTFQFIASREFVEMGAKVLVMPGGGPGLLGGNERGAKGLAQLEGFVGRVVEGPSRL